MSAEKTRKARRSRRTRSIPCWKKLRALWRQLSAWRRKRSVWRRLGANLPPAKPKNSREVPATEGNSLMPSSIHVRESIGPLYQEKNCIETLNSNKGSLNTYFTGVEVQGGRRLHLQCPKHREQRTTRAT